MSSQQIKPGQLFWADLTVKDAATLKEFYKEVIGWKEEPVTMKDGETVYSDYILQTADGTSTAGVCHNRGVNQNIPPQWIVYLHVENIEKSVERCISLGGMVIHENRKPDGMYNYVIIQDPAGALFGIGNAS